MRCGTTSVTSNCVLLSMPTLIGTQLWSFRIQDVGHFRQAQNDNEKQTRPIAVRSLFPPSIFRSILVFQPESLLLGCVHCVFSSPANLPPQSLRWQLTPHNFTAVFVCNRGCRLDRSQQSGVRCLAGNKGRHLSCVTFLRLCHRTSQLPAQRGAMSHVRTAPGDTLGRSHTFATFFTWRS